MYANSINSGHILYLDCFAGIAGDMFVASLLDMTEGEDHLRMELGKIPLADYELKIFRERRGGLDGLRFVVESTEGHIHRHLSDIKGIISASGLSCRVKSEIIRTFTLLAEAEAKVHGESPDNVHFHEVGAVDSIIDISAAMIMLEYLGWPQVIFSPLNVGSGLVRCAHGILPVPAPATAELLKGYEVYSAGDPMERVTPTGAVLVRAHGEKNNTGMPHGRVKMSGVGLGAREGELPNLLRASLFKLSAEHSSEMCVKMSANIDDMTPQDLSFAMEKLFEAGALDVWFEHIQMKKNRPAVKLCLLTHENAVSKLADIMLKDTTTLGLRQTVVNRITLKRRIDLFNSSLGPVRIKYVVSDGIILKQMAEFEDLCKIAKERGLTLSEVRSILAVEKFSLPAEEDDHNKKNDDIQKDDHHTHTH